MIARPDSVRVRLSLACLLTLLLVAPVSAQTPAPLAVETKVTPDFPSGIAFEATVPIEPGIAISRASLFYRIAGDATLNEAPVALSIPGAEGVDVALSRFVDLQSAFIPPGVTLEFFWELETGNGDMLRTAWDSTRWIDSRFDWETAQSGQVTLHTYGMDEEFAEWMLDESRTTLEDLHQRYDLDDIGPVSIWIYPDSGDFAGTRQVNTREAIAGISYPGASLIVAVVPDGNEREFGRVIPHEISHQALNQAIANPFAPPPLWLDEGLATHYQTGGTGHYPGLVWRAASEGVLFDITSLNVSFPHQSAQATLAYASSWSVVEYIQTVYGAEGLGRLIAAFGDGLPVDDAVRRALGVPVDELNGAWHQWILDQGDPDG